MVMKRSTIDGRMESYGQGYDAGYEAGMTEGTRRSKQEHETRRSAERAERDRLEVISKAGTDEPEA